MASTNTKSEIIPLSDQEYKQLRFFWSEISANEIKWMVYRHLDLFRILALRLTNHEERACVDSLLSIEWITQLLDDFNSVDDVQKFVDFCKACHYASADANQFTAIAQFIFHITLPVACHNQLKTLMRLDAKFLEGQSLKFQHEGGEDLSYMGGVNIR